MFLYLNLIKLREITNPRIDMYQISETVAEIWKTAVDDPDCQIIALTGACISAESGIPTFQNVEFPGGETQHYEECKSRSENVVI